MKKMSWRVRLGLGLLAATAVLLGVHYLIFRDVQHIALYGLFDLAMMPIEVLVVTMILHSLLERREHEEMMHKLHMVIGAYFSEVGDELLRRVSAFDTTAGLREHFLVNGTWDARTYAEAKAAAKAHVYDVDVTPADLESLREFIVSKRQFLLGLLQNPSLLEHETFTDVLWAVFHLSEELEYRSGFEALPASDIAHLKGDIKRAYTATAAEWLDHAQHLQNEYPYLFSLAVRLNPLDTRASVTVEA